MDSLVELLFKSPFRPFQIRWQSVRREQLCGCGARCAGEVRTDCLKRRTQNIRRLYIGPRLRLEPAVRPRRAKGDRPVRLAGGGNKLPPRPAAKRPAVYVPYPDSERGGLIGSLHT